MLVSVECNGRTTEVMTSFSRNFNTTEHSSGMIQSLSALIVSTFNGPVAMRDLTFFGKDPLHSRSYREDIKTTMVVDLRVSERHTARGVQSWADLAWLNRVLKDRGSDEDWASINIVERGWSSSVTLREGRVC